MNPQLPPLIHPQDYQRMYQHLHPQWSPITRPHPLAFFQSLLQRVCRTSASQRYPPK